MNIGLLIGRFPPDVIGGAELQTQQLAAELAGRGHNVTVFTRRTTRRPARLVQDGYLIRQRRELPIRGLRGVWDLFPALWDVALHRPRLQVLLCYQTLNSGLIGILAQSLLGIPAVVSIRGNREYRLSDSAVNRLLVPGIYRRARCLIVQSPRIQDDMHAQLCLGGRAQLSKQIRCKTNVIANGIRLPYGARSNGTKVVFIGRLIRNKGVADLLLAAKRLPGLAVLIVGDGPDRARLESLAQGMPVTFVGQVTPSSVVDYLQQARLLVLPSYRGDGLPNVILEAMACRVPVVAANTAGIPDCVRHGETGLLFDPGDVEQMAAHIDRIFTDSELWGHLGACGLEAVESNSWELIAPQIEKLLMEVVSQ